MAGKLSTIFTHQTDSGVTGELGIDEDGRLYWNGQPVITEQRVKLDWWVNISIIVGGVATAVIAILTAVALCLG